MEITYYSNSFPDQWRCNTTMLFTRPQALFTLLFFPLLLGISDSSRLMRTNLIAFAGVEILHVAGWTCIFLGVLWLQTRQRCAYPRQCTTRLAPEGIVDITPDKTTLIPWREVKEIQNRNGDLFFYKSGISGVFIPRTAFPDIHSAGRFIDAARAAARGDFSLLTAPQPVLSGPWDQSGAWPQPTAPQQPSNVWPPPPSPAGYAPMINGAPPGQVDWSDHQDQAKRDAKRQKLQLLRTVFIVPMVVVGLNHSQVAPGRAQIVMIFHLTVILVCLAGLIGVWIAESRLKQP